MTPNRPTSATACCLAVLALALAHAPRNGAATEPRPSLERVERSAWVMGTHLRIVVEAVEAELATRASEAALREVERLERVLGTWDADTEMATVNTAPVGAPVVVPAELAGLLAEAATWAGRTAGAFDPTVGALIDAWDLRGAGRVPTPEELDVALRRTGPGTFEVHAPDPSAVAEGIDRGASAMGEAPGTFAVDAGAPAVWRLVEGAWIDTGGFGKGAALRAAARVLERHEVARALVDLGGQLWARAADGHEPWSVGVAHPERRHEPVLDLSIAGASVATSGTSERSLDVDGRRLGHILDPRTGSPAPAWGSVTVVSADPLEADVLATALYVMGPDYGMAWATEHSGAGVLFARMGRDGPALRWNRAMERWLSAADDLTHGTATAAPPPRRIHGAATAAPLPRKEAHR